MITIRRKTLAAAGLIVASALVLAGCSSSGVDSGAADSGDGGPTPVTIRATTAQVEDANEHLGFWAFVDELKESAPWITVEYMGGPETIPGTEQAEAVMSGAVDMASICACYYSHLVQFADAMALAPTTPLEDRENGALDLQNELHAQYSLHVVGQGLDYYGAQIQLGKKYTELDADDIDLSGWLIRAGAAHMPAVEGLGAEAVNLPIGDVYNAMDRGTIDGFIAGNFGVEGLGLSEPVAATLNVELMGSVYPIIMNLDKWEGLEPETQEAITGAMIAVEGQLADIYQPLVDGQIADFEAAGKTIITPSEAESKRITDIAVKGAWEDLLSRSPEAAEFAKIYGI